MKSKLLYALVASSIATGAAMTASALVLTWVPKGRPRRIAERVVIRPGQMLYHRIHADPRINRMETEGKAVVEAEGKKVALEAEKLAGKKVSAELGRLPHLYNVGVWATSGFLLCLVMTLLFGISSFKEALALGVKVTFTLAFLQAALVLGGYLAFHRLAGS